MQKLAFLHFIFILFFGANSQAQDTNVREYPMEERALLWKIEGNGTETKSYLFGTVHLIDEERFFFPKKLKKIISKSDLLTLEIAGLPNPTEAMKLAMLEEGSFFDFFNQDQTDSMLIWVEENTALKAPAFKAVVDKMRPFAVSMMLPEFDKNNPNPGMDGKKSYEIEFESIAKEKDVEIAGLETVTEQLAIFQELDSTQQAEMVMSIIRNENEDRSDELEKIILKYEEQDIDGLYQLIEESGDDIEGVRDAVLDDRNRRWIPMIEKMIAEKSTFIAVGAGHLGGPNGVLRLLEAQGYILTPVEL